MAQGIRRNPLGVGYPNVCAVAEIDTKVNGRDADINFAWGRSWCYRWREIPISWRILFSDEKAAVEWI
jgi:hypothetical protein